MRKKFFYAHAGSGNHGCEAIVRTSADILGDDIILYSSRPEEDAFYGVDSVLEALQRDLDCGTKKRMKCGGGKILNLIIYIENSTKNKW